MGNNPQSESFNLGSFLGKGMDDIADLPEFLIPPNGSYKVRVEVESKTVNDKPSIQFKYHVLEVVELANPADKEKIPPVGADGKPKAIFSETFYLNNEFGPGALKRHIKAPWDKLGGSIGECLRAIEGQTFYITTKQKSYDSNEDDPQNPGKKLKKVGFNSTGLVMG